MNPNQVYDTSNLAAGYYSSTWRNDTAGNHFWQKANQLHSFLRFAELANQVYPGRDFWTRILSDSPDGSQKGLLSDFQASVEDALKRGDLWTDDYGWGGMACVSACKYFLAVKNTAQATVWCNNAIGCLDHMVALWDDSEDARPVPHGTSNKYVKNTVTNANFMAACIHLYSLLKDNTFEGTSTAKIVSLKYAYKQYLWFQKWFTVKQDPAEGRPYTYLHQAFSPAIVLDLYLIEERPVATPPQGTYPVNTGNPSFEPYSTWSGDQGLFINAAAMLYNNLADVGELFALDAGTIQDLSDSLAKNMRFVVDGVFHVLAQGQVLREAPFGALMDWKWFNEWGQSSDCPDYVCGRGVLLRFLSDEGTRTALKKVNRDVNRFLPVFSATASAVYGAQDKSSGALRAEWDGANTKAAYEKFVTMWRDGDSNQKWVDAWDAGRVGSDSIPVWHNYCQMMGFDVYGAYIRSAFIIGKGEENDRGQGTNGGQNGVHDGI